MFAPQPGLKELHLHAPLAALGSLAAGVPQCADQLETLTRVRVCPPALRLRARHSVWAENLPLVGPGLRDVRYVFLSRMRITVRGAHTRQLWRRTLGLALAWRAWSSSMRFQLHRCWD